MKKDKNDLKGIVDFGNANELWMKAYGVKCPCCGSYDVKFNSNNMLTSFPPKYEFCCNACSNRFYHSLGIDYSQYIEKVPGTPIGMGWICPRCGKVNAPHRDFCDCLRDFNSDKVYCSSTLIKPEVAVNSSEFPKSSENTCTFCGSIIPEGDHICPNCKERASKLSDR